MSTRNFGKAIDRLIAKKDLTGEETLAFFSAVMDNEENDMNQGAFLAALTAKGATAEEIAAIWHVVYEKDTMKVEPLVNAPLVENSGTGMDKIKTFNISTAASVVAAACGAAMARHGARAITSSCGTVDVAEAIGINVETECERISESIERCGIGLFNGMSAKVHPCGLGRILSQCSFGTVLNIAASLANPVKPQFGVRGVNDPQMIDDVAAIMKGIGYQSAVVLHGLQADGSLGIDEASTMGKTVFTKVEASGNISRNEFYPEDFGLKRACPSDIATSGSVEKEAKRLVRILSGKQEGFDCDIVLLNAAMILYVTNLSATIEDGMSLASNALYEGKAYDKLVQWLCFQGEDNNVDQAVNRLEAIERAM
jgi:anthranilate phosphoribosyltransferase